MKPAFLFLLGLILIAPSRARADGNPDFERDAKPILSTQPGLVHYVHTHFVVQETGVARMPGTGDQPPRPPFIFSARPRGVSGPFYLRLLIQPGPEGRILKVADVRQLPPGVSPPAPAPETSSTATTTAPPAPALPPASETSTPAPASSAPADDTNSSTTPLTSAGASGPIRD